ncbi:MAG TPA: tetratricopeptide repeat protein [Chthoniobacterales bacterium]|jgi:tetratricopeptide (TPR) repeat protein|nr:tetratricopeptide repeat protein [Chthoniobacterales bacterium]
MKIRKIAAVAVLVLGSLAADNVAPSKAELEAMYDKAFRAFDANNFPEALKELDSIDARQPDLAESQNLRGVIMMRQGIYDKAEAALHEALRIDSKFWNARFNLAEIPFLRKDWAEARNRFQELLSSNASELQGEATQLIQYKILLTYLLEGKENMVDSILAKFELSPDTPAVHYANAAIALQQNKTKEAKDWMAQAEKNFSPQLNKLFAESLYEVGWLQKQAGQSRAALELTTAAERAAKGKAFARSRVEQARQAYQQRDLVAARKFIDDADAADPNQPATLNLRGEILLEQKQFDQAEAEFKKALKADSKFRQAQFNLALVPLKKKDYATARDRFEALLSKVPGGDKGEAAQLIKFNVYMTWLLEGKDSRAQKLMEQFQFTGDTPALYYAQAAWEFKHNNPTKATDWITSAKKIYSPALNVVFADSFYDLGWMQSPALATSPAPAAEAATALAEAQTESSPAIEPSPIPGAAAAKGKTAEAKTKAAAPAIAGMEATAPKPEEAAASTTVKESSGAAPGSLAAGSPARPEEIPTSPAPNFSPVVETPVAAAGAPASSAVVPSTREEPVVAQSEPAKAPVRAPAPPVAAAKAPVVAAASATPATALAPAHVGEVSRGKFEIGNLFAAILVLAGIGVIGWVVVFEIRRRGIHFPSFRRAAPATGPRLEGMEYAGAAPKEMKVMPRLSGGPRRVSLKLKASEPSLRRAVVPVGKPSRMFGGETAAEPAVEGNGERHLELEPAVETFEAVGPVVEQGAIPTETVSEPAAQPEWFAPQPEQPAVGIPQPVVTQAEEITVPEIQPVFAEAATIAEPEIQPVFSQVEAVAEPEIEPVGQGQPIPQLTPVEEPSIIEVVTEPEPAGFDALRQPSEPSVEPVFESRIYEPTTPVNMPEPIQIPTAPAGRGGAPHPAGAMQTAVQLTFAFEIASMQLTPTFKMGALQLRPASKVVTMRLAGSAPQPAMNLQVTFEIARIQPAGGTLGSVRLTPSQQQRPTVVGSPSFTVGGLHLVSDFAAAPLQLTPSQQGQAAVHVVAPFQIATVEFSPSFEISSIVLNSNSKQVSVQLPSAGGAAVEGAPVFEISNLQLTGSGEIGMMQLNLVGQSPKRAA